MKERLIEFLSYLGMGQTKFEEKIGLSRGLINNIKGEISLKSLKKITDAYPELNEEWLKTGEGAMLKSININEVNGNGNTSVAGNGNQITTANISEMIELQKGYQEMIRTSQLQLSESQSQVNRLITIIEQLHHGKW
jgi:hypothetical protein